MKSHATTLESQKKKMYSKKNVLLSLASDVNGNTFSDGMYQFFILLTIILNNQPTYTDVLSHVDIIINVDDDSECMDNEESSDDNNDDDNNDNDKHDNNNESSQEEVGSQSSRDIIFTTGLGMNVCDPSELHGVVESAAARNQFKESEYVPSRHLHSLVEHWGIRSPQNFCADMIHSVVVVAKEIGFDNALDLCHVRGWIVKKRRSRSRIDEKNDDNDNGGDKFHLEYKRFKECLLFHGINEDHKAFHWKAMVDKLYNNIDTSMLMNGISVNEKKERNRIHHIKEAKPTKKKRKAEKADSQYDMIHVHTASSFISRVTSNTKCLQIALFLIEFLFSSVVPLAGVDMSLIIMLFDGCTSSRRFATYCQALLLIFPNNHPDLNGVRDLYSKARTGTDLFDYVIRKVSFTNDNLGKYVRLANQVMSDRFSRSSVKNYMCRPFLDQLMIMRLVVVRMYISYKGNAVLDCTTKKSRTVQTKSSLHKITDPMLITTGDKNMLQAETPIETETYVETSNASPIDIEHPTSLQFEKMIMSPSIPMSTITNKKPNICSKEMNQKEYNSFYSSFQKRFQGMRLANVNEVSVSAARVYVNGNRYQSSLYCAPVEYYLIDNLRNLEHGFLCDEQGLMPSISRNQVCLEVPISVSYMSTEMSVIRADHPIFLDSFKELKVDLSLLVRFVLRHGDTNIARDGVFSSTSDTAYGSRIDFGCAGSASEELSAGVWRPSLLCGTSIFEQVPMKEQSEILSSLASIYDAMTDAEQAINTELGDCTMNSFAPRNETYAGALRKFLGATKCNTEWVTIQVKCISRKDQVSAHKDVKNCVWDGYTKTGGLCFMLLDTMDTLWSIKFLSNSRSIIGCYFDKLLGVRSICLTIDRHFVKLDAAYMDYMSQCSGGSKKYSDWTLSWKLPNRFFIDESSPWTGVADGKAKDIKYKCIVLPTSIIRDFWLSPCVHIITEMQQLGLKEEHLLEMTLLASYQTSWCRFYHIGSQVIEGIRKGEIIPSDTFETYVTLAYESYGTITGGPYPRFEPPGIDVRKVFLGKQGTTVRHGVTTCVSRLLDCINQHPEALWSQKVLRDMIQYTMREVKNVTQRAELGEFRLGIFIHICALSSLVLVPSKKLLGLLYPIEGKGSYQHLVQAGVSPEHHESAIRRILHHYDITPFGDNAGESIACDAQEHRNVRDIFFHGQNLFMLDEHGQTKKQQFGSRDTWMQYRRQ